MIFRKIFIWGSVLMLASIIIFLYKNYNPLDSILFPKCPFKTATGLLCPGCGSQRAIHNVLNMNILGAIKENLLLVLAVPYIILNLVFTSIKQPSETQLKWRRRLFGEKAIWIVFSVIIIYWVGRNLV